MDIIRILKAFEQMAAAFRECFERLLHGTHCEPFIGDEIKAAFAMQERIDNHREFLKKRYASKRINQKNRNQVCRYWNSRSKHTDILR